MSEIKEKKSCTYIKLKSAITAAKLGKEGSQKKLYTDYKNTFELR